VYSNQQPSGGELGMWLIIYKMNIQNNTDSTVHISTRFLLPPDEVNINEKAFVIFEKDTMELLSKRQIEIRSHSCGVYRFHIDFGKLERLYFEKYETKFTFLQDYLSHVAAKAKIIMVFNKSDTVMLHPNKRLEFEGDPNEENEWFH
jgi:hypothetical protein